MTLSFMIQKKYLVEKVAEQEATGTFHERREYKPFWRTRIGSVHEWGHFFTRAVFLCGRHSFQADVMNITIEETPAEYADVAGKICYNIECKFSSEELEGLSTFLFLAMVKYQ
jgi:hypothetical protein